MRTLLLTLVLLSAGASAQAPAAAAPAVPGLAELQRRHARYAPVDLRLDVSKLPESERRVLAKLVEASRYLDVLYMRQVWPGNEALLLRLREDTSPLGQARLRYFLLNKGPWDLLDHAAPFLPGVGPKPEQGGFYPPGATKRDVEAWVQDLKDEAAQRAATGFFTTIRRTPAGALTAVPYAVEYQGELGEVARLLREAAGLTQEPSLKRFLTLRADALLSNDYYASDVAWMELDAAVEPTFGPYEVYEDNWFNFKAAFESFITLRDDVETQKLARFGKELQGLEDNLPIDPKLRNPKLGGLTPIRVVNSVYSAGDANRGVQTAAFNLPNDERVTAEKGSKRVMLKNVQEAKFQKVLLPIARVALSAKDRRDVDFDAFFTHILMHELMHGLGPHNVTVGGKATTVRQALQASSSAIEEAKADVSGLWALQRLIDQGVIDKRMQRTLYTTFLASAFRTLRFGTGEAHGKGMALQLNHLLDTGAVVVSRDGTFSVVEARIRDSVVQLTRQLMELQAAGDRAGAEALLTKQGVVRPEVKRVLDRLEGVPVDIAPRFVTAEALERQYR